MLQLLTAHWGTILAGGILLIIVALIIVKMVKDRREGKSSCGCNTGCAGCPNTACSSWKKNIPNPKDV